MKVLCLGDLSLDTYLKENKSFFGGCSLNVARQLNEKLGHKETALYIPLGNDQNSKEAQKYLETLTIEMRLKILEGELPRQPITIDENGERHLHDYVGGVLTEFTCEDLGKFFLSRFELILFPFFKQVELMTQSLLDLNPKAKLACDFGNLSDYDGDLEVAKKFFPSLSYAQFSSESSDKEKREFLRKSSEDYELILVETMGSRGARVFNKGIELFSEAPEIFQIVDSTGAGDAFFAHFLHSHIINEKTLQKSLEIACHGGAQQVSHLGPGPISLLQ
ncbi:MAG: hypothetical protein CME70_23590 [Halobacteriovorax sp.]|nr:hypothetical protein [Halobacteriovorax sp.]|tara:strand:- start:162995 stop:163825 length:831 start_codon:yes stop_codon:yes gene_type:complete